MAEEVIWTGGRSPLYLLSYWVVCLILLLLFFLVITIPPALIVAALGVLKMYRKRYCVTTQRIKTEFGLLSRVVRDASLEKIQDTLVKQSILGRFLNYGDLYFSTAGSNDFEIIFESVSDPEGLKARIRDLKKAG